MERAWQQDRVPGESLQHAPPAGGAGFFSCGTGNSAEPPRPVARDVATVEDAVRALLAGPTVPEQLQGYGSSFHDHTALLEGVDIDDGTVTVRLGAGLFTITNITTTGGAAATRAQLNATVFQFPEVATIVYQVGDDPDAWCRGFEGVAGCERVERSEWEARAVVPTTVPGPVDVSCTAEAILPAVERDVETSYAAVDVIVNQCAGGYARVFASFDVPECVPGILCLEEGVGVFLAAAADGWRVITWGSDIPCTDPRYGSDLAADLRAACAALGIS